MKEDEVLQFSTVEEVGKEFPLFSSIVRNPHNCKEFQGSLSITYWISEEQYNSLLKEIDTENTFITANISIAGYYTGSKESTKLEMLEKPETFDFNVTINERENADKSKRYWNIQFNSTINRTGVNFQGFTFRKI